LKSAHLDPYPVDLIRACAASSDDEPWERFLERCGPRLRSEVRRALLRARTFPTRDLVEDLEQEVLCRLLERERRALARFRGATEEEAGVYLGRVVASVVIDALRSAGAAKRAPLYPPVSLQHVEEVDEAALEDRRHCPEGRLLAHERGRQFLDRCASALTRERLPERRRALALALVGGLTSQEIAARLGGRWLPGTIDAMVSRARRRLARAGIELPPRPTSRRASGACAPRELG
jgi:RNA polymerase sigma factor (sigma-70 family)